MSIETVSVAALKPMSDGAHFAQAVKAGGLLFCSGALGFDPTTGKVSDDLETEFRSAFKMIGALLGEAGLGYADIVEVTSYHKDFAKTMPTFASVRDEFLKEPWGAWTAIEVVGFAAPGANVEIRVIAQLK